MIHIPEKVIFCDGVQVLLNGCVETRNCQLLQNAVTVCLYHLNHSQFRQKKTILDLQVTFIWNHVEMITVTFIHYWFFFFWSDTVIHSLWLLPFTAFFPNHTLDHSRSASRWIQIHSYQQTRRSSNRPLHVQFINAHNHANVAGVLYLLGGSQWIE